MYFPFNLRVCDQPTAEVSSGKTEEIYLEQTKKQPRSPVPYQISRGQPLPLGATLKPNGDQFLGVFPKWDRGDSGFFPPGKTRSRLEFTLDSRFNRTGDIWHAFVTGVDRGIEYGYRVEQSPNSEPHIHRFRWPFRAAGSLRQGSLGR